MGAHFVAVHVRERTLDDLAGAALLRTDRYIAVEDATSLSFGGLAATEGAGGVTLLSGAPDYLALGERLESALGAEVVMALLNSTSDTYGWFVHRDGSRREWVFQGGVAVEDVGDRLPEESGVTRLDDDVLLEMFAQRTGVRLDWDGRVELMQPGAAPNRRRGLFRRRSA